MHGLIAPADMAGARAAPGLPAAAPVHEDERGFCLRIGRLALRSLYAELTLYPKPGLVSLRDNGSHDDMSAETFMRSIFALRHYFVRITLAGSRGAPFGVLAALGIEAERRMLAATGGVNTHRGAIFGLGLLCAAIGNCRAQGEALSAQAIRAAMVARWGAALAAHARTPNTGSHGRRVAARHGVGGARHEAARGLPAVFEVALPALRRALAAGRGQRRARVDTLFALMAHIGDTNVYHRGGAAGAATVSRHARAFLASGGTGAAGWEERAERCHRLFVARRLSPGGAADLLAAACLVDAVTAGDA
ncbi:triphosphoribosyl-dephospho-CoA synthase MdcB [Massilia niabensis]|uniref:Probable 2-(5''-triphosphoribosyl)-3'-dephosphocoenzyme-A synthase n=1 Tax=Massilia niabensis TaxID=544910 RepID=A0ABW0L5J6_9BURK